MMRRLKYLFGVTKEAFRRFEDDDHVAYAGYMAFTLLLSFGPFVVCLILAAEALAPESVDSLKGMIVAFKDGMLIPDNMASVLLGVIEAVSSDSGAQNENIILVVISGLVGLWAGSNAFESARKGFNEAYDVRDKRGFSIKRLQSLLLAAVMASLFIMLSLAIVITSLTLGVLGASQEAGQHMAIYLVPALFGAPLFLVLLIGIHLTLPRGFARRWSLYLWAQDETADARAVRVPVLPGVFISAILWLLGAIGFSIALSTIMSLEGKHGGLAGVVATLLFFYMSSAIIFLGAQINIAIATIGADGKPVWPHPSFEQRPEDYDPRKDEAFVVLTLYRPKGNPISRLWHYLVGGTVVDPTLAEAEGVEISDDELAAMMRRRPKSKPGARGLQEVRLDPAE
ncbi:MAG: YihY/virulence factor BrkB family protein [Pseudomonadota bacterium]